MLWLLIGRGGDDKLAEWVSGVIGQRGPSHDPSCDLTLTVAVFFIFDKYLNTASIYYTGFLDIALLRKTSLILLTGHELNPGW